VEKLRTVVRACLTGESKDGTLVLDATNRRGKPIKCRVTCSPLVAGARGTRGAIILMAEEAV
jgi:two-component system CheB/CheR fusion protein